MITVRFNGVNCPAYPALGIEAMNKGQCYWVYYAGQHILCAVHELEPARE